MTRDEGRSLGRRAEYLGCLVPVAESSMHDVVQVRSRGCVYENSGRGGRGEEGKRSRGVEGGPLSGMSGAWVTWEGGGRLCQR